MGALAQLPVSKAVASDLRLLRGFSTARSVDPESDAPPAAVTGGPLTLGEMLVVSLDARPLPESTGVGSGLS